MFGYATDETEECMPLTVVLAHRLNQKIAELRRAGILTWARPDSKTQVSYHFNEIQEQFYKILFRDAKYYYTFEYFLIRMIDKLY
jgi:S-adenosylmethionine synthetase